MRQARKPLPRRRAACSTEKRRAPDNPHLWVKWYLTPGRPVVCVLCFIRGLRSGCSSRWLLDSRLESRNINARRTTRSCRRTERIVFVTTKDYRGQDGGRVVVLPIARGQDIRLALARAGRHDFLAAAATATLATAALTANVAPRVTIVLP